MSKHAMMIFAGTVAGVLAFAGPVAAQQGPVGQACTEEIAKYCADKEHGRGEVRACLEANRDKVGAACKEALETTGGGRGMGGGRANGQGQ